LALTPGTRLGPYEILAALGAGGMGEVYRAHDTRLNRDVALKSLLPEVADNPERLARFRREAQILASLNHQNIGHIYGLEERDGVVALVLELVDGPTLDDRIAQGPIPIDEALPIAKQIAEALEAAHEQGIVHRDLKPANIKVRADGTVKVLDFGLAKAVERQGDQSDPSASPTITSPAMLTGIGMILGTAAYMAPEQTKGRPADKRSDVWAFGCVLFEMLTGRRAFDAEDTAQTIASILLHEPRWDTLPSGCPPLMRRLVRRCLERDRTRRLADIADARLELEDIRGAGLGSEPQVGRTGASFLPWTISAVSAAVMIAVVAFAGLSTRTSQTSAPRELTQLDVVTPPTIDPLAFALSPDGRQLTFVANGSDGSQLWLRRLDEPTARPLSGTVGAQSPFWSPDASSIGFFADGLLKRLDLSSGATQALTAGFARGGAWNRDGVIVFSTGASAPLSRILASGGPVEPATKLGENQISHRWPHFLPDSRRFVFEVANGPLGARGVYLGSLDETTSTRLASTETEAAYAAPGYLLLLSQGTLFARRIEAATGSLDSEAVPIAKGIGFDGSQRRGGFSVSDGNVLAYRARGATRRDLVWVDRQGRALGTLVANDESGLAYPDLSPDGRRVAMYRNEQGFGNIWIADVASGRLTPFTLGTRNLASPVWSSDGQRVVFRDARAPGWDLFIKSDDRDEQSLLSDGREKSPQDCSSDGRFLLFSVQSPQTQSDLWVLPLGGGTPSQLIHSDADEVQAQFSPDGHWFAYVSNETGRYEVYVQPFPGLGAKRRISTGGGVFPRWRRDGRELFFATLDNRMMAVPVSFPTGTLALGPVEELFRSRMALGANSGFGGYGSRAPYAVSPDGRFLLDVISDDASQSSITVMQNWQSLVTR
jgi:eukaryotic-like serine/threonine-protein kinase